MLANVRSFAGFRHASRPSLRPLLFSGEDLREDVNVFYGGQNHLHPARFEDFPGRRE